MTCRFSDLAVGSHVYTNEEVSIK